MSTMFPEEKTEEQVEAERRAAPFIYATPAVIMTVAQRETIERLSGRTLEGEPYGSHDLNIYAETHSVYRQVGGRTVLEPTGNVCFEQFLDDNETYYQYVVQPDGKYEQEWARIREWESGINSNASDDHPDLIAYRECEECGNELDDDRKCEYTCDDCDLSHTDCQC